MVFRRSPIWILTRPYLAFLVRSVGIGPPQVDHTRTSVGTGTKRQKNCSCHPGQRRTKQFLVSNEFLSFLKYLFLVFIRGGQIHLLSTVVQVQVSL